MSAIIKTARYFFLVITLLALIPAIGSLVYPPEHPNVALVWIIFAGSCVGVISTWRSEK